MASAPTFACAYFGPPNECSECGGHDPTGTGFCSHNCREAHENAKARDAAWWQARRERDDAFAAEVARLRALGYSYEECDVMLAGMPS